MPDTFWERVRFRRKYIGKVQRGGVVYKKYMKVHRFRRMHLHLLLILLGGIVAARLVARLLARLDEPMAASDTLPTANE